MLKNNTNFLKDLLRRTSFYDWLRRRRLLQQLRDIIRLAKILGLRKAIGLSQRLWNEPNSIVEATSRSIQHPVFLRSRSSDSRVFCEIFADKIYDFGHINNVSFIIDAGANIGLASIFLANQYPEARIVAVEPSSANISILRKNIAFYPNIIAREAALWPRNEALRFKEENFEYWALRVEKTGATEEAGFATVTIPMLMAEYALTHIDILKIDIEGAEQQLLLEGDPSWLSSVQSLIIELHGDLARDRFGEINSVMANHGLHLISGGENCLFSRDFGDGKSKRVA